ncbi:MAG: hypothetical protein CML81_05440 [Rhodobiaceae bacterium]|nr:hypothetical protein [Rhodobiaceae bacterium]RPF96655.1 MAG: gfo/Idh/MocA family oxidoreductase [Rhizobiales bacterium TMED227]
MTINIALLGTGRIAEIGYVPAIQQISDTNIISVLSRDKAKGEAFAKKHQIKNSYADLDELLRDESLDAVIICTPDAMHEEQVIKSCRANKHVLCEKPMSTDYQSCLRMIEEIKKSKIIFGMAYNNRFNAGLRYIKEQIEKDQIGNIYYARAMLSTQQNDPEGWRALGGQSKFWAMSATGTHMIDIFRWYFGEPVDSKIISLSPKYSSPNDEISTLTMNFNNKILCDVTASAILPRVNRIEVYSDTDVIIGENVFGIKTDEKVYHNNKKILIEPISSFFGEVLDFTNAIIKNRSPRSTFEDGIKNLIIMQS